MQAVVNVARSIFSLPYEVINAVLQRVRPRDVDSFGRTCHQSFALVNGTRFIDGYLREHPWSACPAPQAPATLPWLRQSCAVSPQQMQARSTDLATAEGRQRGIATLRASDLLGAEPTKMQVLASGDFTTVDCGQTIRSVNWPGRTFYAAARRDRDTGAAQALVFMLPQELGYPTLATACFGFPSEDVEPNARRAFALYRVGEHLVGLCTAGAQTRVFVVVPARYALHQLRDNVLTPHPLMDIALTSHGMAPISWARKARAVLVWNTGTPELWAVAEPL